MSMMSPNFSRDPVRITNLKIDGFKSYLTEQSVGFAPLTLIYGSNASGKSSILQAMRFLGANARSGIQYQNQSPFLTSVAPGLDLGDFKNYVSGHSNRSMSLEVTANSDGFPGGQSISLKYQIDSDGVNPGGVLTKVIITTFEHEYRVAIQQNERTNRRFGRVTEFDLGGREVGQVDQQLSVRGLLLQDNFANVASGQRAYDSAFSLAIRAQRKVLAHLSNFLYVGPHREQLPRVAFEDDLGQFGNSTSNRSDFWTRWLRGLSESPEDLQKVNDAFSDLDIPYEMRVEKLSLGGMSEIAIAGSPIIPYFFDLDNKTHVFAKDIGYGVSQVLPIVMATALSVNENLHMMIEQPELHLHPRLQGRLANLFVSAAKRGRPISVETHSEHLILRIQKLIRTGECDPSLVKVIFVERTDLGALTHELRMNEIGNFVDDWPGGFFEERLEELF
jgi:hypothetical protein